MCILPSLFDAGVCMCLDKRLSRCNATCKPFEDRGLRMERFVMGKGMLLHSSCYNWLDDMRWPQTVNYTQAVKAMLAIMKARAVGTLFICEDDVLIHDDFDDVLAAASVTLTERKLDWDILYLGGNRCQADFHEVNSHLLETRNVTGLFAVGLRSTVFDAILGLEPRPWMGIDGLLQEYVQASFRVYSVFPSVVDQIPGGWSFSCNCRSDASFQQSWRHLKGRFRQSQSMYR
jgi:hypothetical protein